jgi:hypothetical protein
MNRHAKEKSRWRHYDEHQKRTAWKPWHGFAIEIGPDTDLGGEAS